ncbi:hypothetical protein BROC_02030 [Candidatus Brocadiaceae bacterium]|nr:hypothetical protein BROC_02030 [Candidatus Brocadiaceae bacterium]
MIKWKLMLTTLPFVFVILSFTYLRVEVLQITGLLEFSDTAPIITATALVIGFMLAGIMADYKEGEKLPADIASALQAIDDCIIADSNHLTETDFLLLKKTNMQLCEHIVSWLFNRESAENSYITMQAILLSSGSSPAFKNNVLKNIDALRRSITRVDVIRRTDFIKTGYALLEVFVTITLGLLTLANFKNQIAEYLIVGSISLIYVYMIRLIRDLDNPFDYEQDGSCAGAAEVDHFPLLEAQKRLINSLAHQYHHKGNAEIISRG